jgi:polyribonucleotide nucleotidyltransferase
MEKLSLDQTQSIDLGGRALIMGTGKLAGQADAAVTINYGNTLVLVTVCTNPDPREGTDFLPLTIDYEERLYAAGKIPGGFIRREGRPTEQAILASRLTDRPLRPLLPKSWRRDIQIIITVLSADQENDPDILAVIGGSAVLQLSEIPFAGPVSAVRVGYINNELALNPTLVQLEDSRLDLVVVSTKEAIVMVEAGAREVTEDEMVNAVKLGHQANQHVIKLQEQFQEVHGKPKIEVTDKIISPDLVSAMSPLIDEKLPQALEQTAKSRREQAITSLRRELVETLGESFPEADIRTALEAKIKAEVRARILEKGNRVDGRSLTEVRNIDCEVALLPRTHGSALFTRGQTQVLTITTLGSVRQEQPLDGLGIEEAKRFIHHYNFPPFSSGEVKRVGTPGRREIGHGALAGRALLPVLPKDKEFPYTIRLVSEVLSSNGSTSMASVCAGSLSLMDAGIPIKAAVAGVAMGLVTNEKGEYAIMTDIEGFEDANGDMDFKVAGTTEGITAMQMDTKLKGVNLEIIEKTLNQAKEARLYILDKMGKTISASRSEVSKYAPRMYKMTIDADKIGTVIGTGGKTIRSIISETKTTIDIGEDGAVLIGSSDEAAAQKAIQIIESLTKEVEIGTVYTGKVTRLLNFGAMVEILPGKEGLVHISELAEYRVPSVEDEVKVGEEIVVKVIGIDNMGRINLSRKAMLETSSQASEEKPRDSVSPSYRPNRPYGGRPPQRPYPQRDKQYPRR